MLRALISALRVSPQARGRSVLCGARRTLALGTAALSMIAPQAFASDDSAYDHTDLIQICDKHTSGMDELLSFAKELDWDPLTNADYAERGQLVQEIEWVFLASHNPFTKQDINVDTLVRMEGIIAANDRQARQYISSAPTDELLGDPARRLLKSPHSSGSIMAVQMPGDYGSGAVCVLVSPQPAPERFLRHITRLAEFPPQNSLLTTARIRAADLSAVDDLPRRIYVVREFDPQRLAAFTEYQMHTVHSFELRLYTKGGS